MEQIKFFRMTAALGVPESVRIQEFETGVNNRLKENPKINIVKREFTEDGDEWTIVYFYNRPAE